MKGPGGDGAGGGRVLLFAGDADQRGALADGLRARNVAVEAVADTAAALQRLRDGDHLVAFATLPESEGMGAAFVREARAARPGTPVVLIAGRERAAEAIDGIRHGAWNYLVEPVGPEHLLYLVRRAVDARAGGGAAGADPGRVPAEVELRWMLKSQFHAALAMLRDAVERCPDALWDDPRFRNRTWQIAYHALFFARYYGGGDETFDDFWEGHRRETQNPDGIGGEPRPGSPLPFLPERYTQAEVLAACDHCIAGIDAAVDALDLPAAQCGFPWYPMGKLEHQMVNLRHVQHHVGQLSERLRQEVDLGVRWVGMRRK